MTLTEDESLEKNDLELNKITRKLLLSKLYSLIEIMEQRCLKGRVHDPKVTNAKTSQIKAFGYLCSIYSQVSRDVELEELKEDIEELKQMMK